ncbi:unnamed protein product [Leptidea sinapis]|uniref:Uncharacterized protein n=1 Tax=Leptidea sinapis TaxID=189913 RepID=A0A5E4R510_9NEOP|nr:unnamed protein product [Leptidea sinapis]
MELYGAVHVGEQEKLREAQIGTPQRSGNQECQRPFRYYLIQIEKAKVEGPEGELFYGRDHDSSRWECSTYTGGYRRTTIAPQPFQVKFVPRSQPTPAILIGLYFTYRNHQTDRGDVANLLKSSLKAFGDNTQMISLVPSLRENILSPDISGHLKALENIKIMKPTITAIILTSRE